LAIGKPKKFYIEEGILDFLNRLKHYTRIELIELNEPDKSKKIYPQKIKQSEAKKMKSRCRASEFVIALDRKGEMLDSEKLALFLQDCMVQNRTSLTFLIGGELGLTDEIMSTANKILSLSKMTFTHDMSRLILLEQLYRAFKIIAGQKYHK
jgi:23S rRNA (pseudouridine1915-N3)-methyltransferase